MESVLTQTHALMAARDNGVKEVLYSSSACIYPQEIQADIKDAAAQGLKEQDAYPANPEDGYGWEKLFSEIITHYFQEDFMYYFNFYSERRKNMFLKPFKLLKLNNYINHTLKFIFYIFS